MRSLFYAMGYTEEELARPLVAVVSAHSEIVPGHMHLDKITEAVKAGVRMAGGTPIMVPAIGVCAGQPRADRGQCGDDGHGACVRRRGAGAEL